MLQVKKLHYCGISAVFFQCCFMIETQVLMTVSDFLRFFSRNHFLEGGFPFQWGVISQLGASFLCAEGRGGGRMRGIGFDGGFLKKNQKIEEGNSPPPSETLKKVLHF